MTRIGRTTRQRGLIFVAALIVLAAMAVVVVALASEVTLDLRMAANLVDADQAVEAAKVGLDLIAYTANNNPAWRTAYTSGTWVTSIVLGDSTIDLCTADEDGDLADCPIDPVTVWSVGRHKGTVRTLRATLAPPGHEAMMFLAYIWDNKITIEAQPRVYGDICSGDTVEVNGPLPDFRGDLYVENADKVKAPLDDADTDVVVFSKHPTQPSVDLNWFISRGSSIAPPEIDGKYQIVDKVISPTTNPYGFSNANGIYYIECGKEVVFTRCHITATIVVRSAHKVYFREAGVHAPAESHYPALVTDDELLYEFDKNLSEAESNVDFNGDGDKTDTLTPSVSGVVYAAKRITGLQASGGTNIVRFKGILISREITLIGSGCIFEQDTGLATNLVNQFQGTGLKLVKGSVNIE